MNIFRPDGPLMEVLRKIMYLLLLNMIFLVCCIPVITIGPAFTSLSYSIQKTLKHDLSYPIKEYFQCFRRCFKQSCLFGVVVTLIALMFVCDVWILKEVVAEGAAFGNTYVFFYVLGIFLFLFAVWVLGSIARFTNSLKNIMKNASILMIRHMGTSILILLITAVCVVCMMLLPITMIVMPAVMVWLMTEVMERVFKKYMTPEELEREAKKDMIDED